MDIPNSTINKRNREVQQTLKDAEFVGTHRMGKREWRQPERYTGYMEIVGQLVDSEPFSYQEFAQQQVWQGAMVEEYSSMMQNDIWEVVPRSIDKAVVGSCWTYKIKHDADGSIEKYNARFVAKWFS